MRNETGETVSRTRMGGHLAWRVDIWRVLFWILGSQQGYETRNPCNCVHQPSGIQPKKMLEIRAFP
jgi:hypothetical protein